MTDKVERRETSCFTYEVNMVIQILAQTREEANAKLEAEGGFVSMRTVTFKDFVPLYSGPAADAKESETPEVPEAEPEDA
jgi:hypothetical protein